MRHHVVVNTVVLVFLSAGLALGADQTILGKQFLLTDPKPGVDATKRKLVAQGKEGASANQIVGDPTVAGGALTVIVSGATSANQVFVLPQGTDPASGKPFWSAQGSGFKYKDAKGANGPVKLVQIKRSGGGTFQIKAIGLGKNGAIALVPPDPGASACVRLDLAGGDRYSVVLPPAPDATIKKNDAETFLSKNAFTEGAVCELAAAACGNGVIEPGEWCDGDEFCEPNCTIRRFACCDLPISNGGSCSASVPAFTLITQQDAFCGRFGGTFRHGFVAASGGMCTEPVQNFSSPQQAGACVPAPELAAPVSVCCEDSQASTCGDLTTASQAEIGAFVWSCLYTNYPFAPVVAGTCSGGQCVPAH